MTARAFLSLAFVCALAGMAAADKTVGVLGLEVAGAIDAQGIMVAKNLTEAMRTEAKATSGYTVPNSANKELIDEKVAVGCDNEAVDCMSKIATKLGVQLLIFGKIETKTKDAADGYTLTVKLLDVEKKTIKKESSTITIGEISESQEGKRAVAVFHSVTGTQPPAGTVGTVLPDPPKKPGKKSNGWRPVAYISGAATVVAGGAFVYAGLQIQKTDGGKKCTELEGGGFSGPAACANGDRNNKIMWVTGPLALGLLGVTIFATYKGFVSSSGDESSEPKGVTGTSTKRKRDRFSVTPVVSPDGAGATVRFDW